MCEKLSEISNVEIFAQLNCSKEPLVLRFQKNCESVDSFSYSEVTTAKL
jgi:hypothetical protein